MKTIYKRPAIFREGAPTLYCGGCGHGIVGNIIGELVEELDLYDDGIMVWPIGCSNLAERYIDFDMMFGLHGRAPAVATGIKRAEPNKFVMVYQGDGDMASEGLAEIISAAIRGEKFSVIFMNNSVFGMTGAQMAPTTLMDQVTTTSPTGRMRDNAGYPVKMAELVATQEGVIYSERCTVSSPANIAACKRAIKKIFELQLSGADGMGFVEILSPCPTGWKMKPVKALEWIDQEMTKVYPLGVIKDTTKDILKEG